MNPVGVTKNLNPRGVYGSKCLFFVYQYQHTLPQQHLNCLNVSTSHKMNNNCNKKDNILIYNNLDKITNSTLDNETLRQLRQFCKAFSNDYTSPTSWIRQSSFPVLENNIAIMTREIVNVDLKEMARERGKRE